MFGMVLQDTWLFSGTIMENIRYGRLDATDEEVIAAAKRPISTTLSCSSPAAIRWSWIEETSNVSQGQKQLLTIARELLSHNISPISMRPPLFFDTKQEFKTSDNG